MARQIWESVRIDRLAADKEACLNLKSEWGQSQTPGLQSKCWRPPAREPRDVEKGRRGREDILEEEGSRQPPPPNKRRCQEDISRTGKFIPFPER